MENQIEIKKLNEGIENLGLPPINSLNYLTNLEPVIYLCGKSSSGKTTFLNALFNFKKNELYTSTDISTKTEFRFKYGTEEIIKQLSGDDIMLPSSFSERKELFENLNIEGEKYTIYLNQKSLHGRVIVDIPGVFDFKRNDSFSKKMLDEADIIYFFTPCTAKIDSTVLELLKNISEDGIPIIVIFTMGDLTDVDEGITRKTIPNIVDSLLNTSFNGINISHYQIISSNDFYKGKESHGIDKIQHHINLNDQNYKKIAENSRLKKSFNYYIKLIEDRLINLETDNVTFINLVKRENKLWQQSETNKIIDKKNKIIHNIESELNWFYKNCEEIIYGISIRKVFSKQMTSPTEMKRKFETNWNEFWLQIIKDYEFLNITVPKLPIISENIFEQVSVDFEKFRKILGEKPSISEKKDNRDRAKKSVNESEENKTSENQNKHDATENEGLTIADFLFLISEAGINSKNGKILYNKWSFLSNFKEIIEEIKKDFTKQVDFEFDKKINNMRVEMEQRIEKSLLENVTKKKIDAHKNVLLNFNEIINDF